MENNKIAVGLDIGTTKIVAMIGRKNEYGKLEILGIGKAKSLGVKRGVVSNITQTIQSIQQAVEESESVSGQKIENVVVGIAGQHIRSLHHSDYITRSNADEVIDENDIENLVQVSSIRNIGRCVKSAGLDLSDITLEPLASASAVLSQEEKEAGVALIDIGGGTTDLAIFKDGIIRHTAVIPFGGNVITEDIKEGCSIIEKQAELLKIKFGSAWPGENKETEIVSIPGLRGREPKEITLKNLSKIIHARVQEIIEHVYLEIKNYGHETQKGKLIAGIVLTGGGSQLKHLRQLVEYITGMDARIGYPNEHLAGDSDEGLSSPSYATAVGLLMEGLENHSREDKEEQERQKQEENVEENVPELDPKPKTNKKSFFDKFTDGLKEFLDNAE